MVCNSVYPYWASQLWRGSTGFACLFPPPPPHPHLHTALLWFLPAGAARLCTASLFTYEASCLTIRAPHRLPRSPRVPAATSGKPFPRTCRRTLHPARPLSMSPKLLCPCCLCFQPLARGAGPNPGVGTGQNCLLRHFKAPIASDNAGSLRVTPTKSESPHPNSTLPSTLVPTLCLTRLQHKTIPPLPPAL